MSGLVTARQKLESQQQENKSVQKVWALFQDDEAYRILTETRNSTH